MEKTTGKPDILVSVDICVYNHEKYLAQAIESVLMQEGDFSLELLIHDDASTDRSPEIIRSYAEKYPEIVKPILQSENQYSQRISILSEFQAPRYSGKYVAYCEGDDYWTDPRKLQKQVAFLESHPDFVAVGHNVKFVDENGDNYTGPTPKRWTRMPDYEFTLKDTDAHQMFGQTASRVYRNLWKERPELIGYYRQMEHTHGDTRLSLIFSCLGRIWYLSDVMSAYRKSTTNGSWSARVQKKNQARRKIESLEESIRVAAKLGKTITMKNEYEKTLYLAIRTYLRDRTEENREILNYVWGKYPYRAACGFALIKQFGQTVLARL